MLVASHAATSSYRELRKRRAFVLGGDTLCFELAQRPEHSRHQPSASLKAACQIDRLSLISTQDVTSAPSKSRKTVNIDPSQKQQLLLAPQLILTARRFSARTAFVGLRRRPDWTGQDSLESRSSPPIPRAVRRRKKLFGERWRGWLEPRGARTPSTTRRRRGLCARRTRRIWRR